MHLNKVGHFEIVELLISKGASVRNRDNDGYTSLYVASDHGKFVELFILISKGASVKGKSNKGNSPIISACSNGNIKVIL